MMVEWGDEQGERLVSRRHGGYRESPNSLT